MPARILRSNSLIAPGTGFSGDRGDLTELLGNLLDNACKWCRSRVRLSAASDAAAEMRARLRLDPRG